MTAGSDPTTPPVRDDGRAFDELRPVTITTGVQEFAEGSVLISFGKTRVLCAASVESSLPRWRMGSGLGWVTAEYSMLPRATNDRSQREAVRGKLGGRTHEIQRLIGRSLRSAIDLKALGEHSIIVDCDVLQADGGTRTASITGAWVALSLALDHLVEKGVRRRRPRLDPLAAISVGIVNGLPLLDLCYTEDSSADVDMNVVMLGDGLGGDPGVRSARYAGRHGDDEANLRLVLERLGDTPDRRAHFECAAALVAPDGREWTATGVVEGEIVGQPRGSNGFGYDPIFQPLGAMLTTAEMSPEQKDSISHRGKAFRAIVPAVAELAQSPSASSSSSSDSTTSQRSQQSGQR